MNTLIDPNDNDMWLQAINGKYFGGRPFTKREWDMLLGHCQVRIHNLHPPSEHVIVVIIPILLKLLLCLEDADTCIELIYGNDKLTLLPGCL